MSSSDFQLRTISDPRLVVHATSRLPTWLWSIDGARVLWANPTGARLFGAANSAELAQTTFGPADRRRRQIAQLARRLPANGAVRLERLRDFGASLGMLTTCACTRLELPDGSHGVLVTAMAAIDRDVPMVERPPQLAGTTMPMAAGTHASAFNGEGEIAHALPSSRDLGETHFEQLRGELKPGKVEAPVGTGHSVPKGVAFQGGTLQEIGTSGTTASANLGSNLGLGALMESFARRTTHATCGPVASEQATSTIMAEPTTEAPPGAPVHPAQDTTVKPCEQPALSNEAPARFALFDILRRFISDTESPVPPDPPAAIAETAAEADVETESPPAVELAVPEPSAELAEPTMEANSQPTDLENSVAPPNVVPFRPTGETRAPTLTPVENSAFNELARQLSERLERVKKDAAALASEREIAQAAAEPLPRGDNSHSLLDLLPTGILIYQPARLLHANPAFLARMGYTSLRALEDAGGINTLHVEPDMTSASSASEAGKPVTISAGNAIEAPADAAAIEARLHNIDWDGGRAMALICTPAQTEQAHAQAVTASAKEAEPEPQFKAGQTNADDLAAILDTAPEGIILFDAEGNIRVCNRSAKALFNCHDEDLAERNLATLFAPESQRVVTDCLERLKGLPDNGHQGLHRQGMDHQLAEREVLGRESKGGLIPLAMTMGRTRPESANFFAVFRDLSRSKSGESELKQTPRLGDDAANAKAEMLTRISHEIRTPLTTIIGIAEVMMSDRLGTLKLGSGHERYGEYMKDIRASGERVISIIDELLEVSRIETGKLDLTFTKLNLNDLVEASVSVMQPQANRERIIIRTSLTRALPPVYVDASAMRQIAMNLISNSIQLAGTGGQVIVSTALTDRGDVALRIRDTGHGAGAKEVAPTTNLIRPPTPDANSGLNLSLTRALVEANHAQFNIKSAANSGTLIEVVFSPARA